MFRYLEVLDPQSSIPSLTRKSGDDHNQREGGRTLILAILAGDGGAAQSQLIIVTVEAALVVELCYAFHPYYGNLLNNQRHAFGINPPHKFA